MTEAQRSNYEQMVFAMSKAGVPEHLWSGLGLYHIVGVLPGGFLTAVLEHDLFEAVATGDTESLAGLIDIVRFIYQEFPMAAHGLHRVSTWRGAEFVVDR